MFDLTAKSFLKTAKFGLGVTVLVLATACSHEVVQQAPLETSANAGVENIPDATPTPEPSEALASTLDQGPNLSAPAQTPTKHNGKKSHASLPHGRRYLARGTNHKTRSGKVARKIVKGRKSQKIAAYKQSAAITGTTQQLNEGAVNLAATQSPTPPAPPTPAAIGSVGDGNLGTVDVNAIENGGGFLSTLVGFWPYGLFAVILGGGLFFATRSGRYSLKGKKRGSLVFNS